MKNTLALLLVVTLTVSGCYGPFNLTRKVHHWNGEVGESKWTNEAVFLGLAILNVYTVAALADVVIFNSVEFWSGKNPINAKTTRSAARGEAVASVTYDPAVPSLRVIERMPERPERVLELRLIKEGVVALDATGRIIMYSRRVESRIVVTDNEAHVIRVYEPDEVARLAQPARVVAGR
jgi:hypothetical protein